MDWDCKACWQLIYNGRLPLYVGLMGADIKLCTNNSPAYPTQPVWFPSSIP